MFKKLNTTTLIIILLVLGGIAAFNKFYWSERSENTFDSEFVKIDTASVSQILIYPKAEKGKEIKISKIAVGWELQNDKIKTAADTSAIKNLLASFVEIKANALAGEDKQSWRELQVDDSSGSRIKIITSSNATYDFVVGKFGYNQAARNGVTYIRKTEEDQTYAIDGFLSFSANSPFNAWRRKIFISGNKDNWNSLTFSYPGDSSFVLSKQNNLWTANGEPIDSAKAAQYLNTLAAMQNSSFVDQFIPSSTPLFTLNIQGNNQPAPIIVVAYLADSVQKYVLHSSLNADAYFSDAQTNLSQKIFVGKRTFLNSGSIGPKR